MPIARPWRMRRPTPATQSPAPEPEIATADRWRERIEATKAALPWPAREWAELYRVAPTTPDRVTRDWWRALHVMVRRCEHRARLRTDTERGRVKSDG